MSFDPDRNYLLKWIEIDPDRIWFGTMSVQLDATEVDLSGSDLDNVSSVDRPLLLFCSHFLTHNYMKYIVYLQIILYKSEFSSFFSFLE